MISLQKRREYYRINKERINALRRISNEANKEKVKQRKRDWNNANKDKKKIYDKTYYENNKEKLKQKIKNYRKLHNDKRNQLEKEKRSKDLSYHIKSILRGRLRLALNGNIKSQSTIKLLGCDISFFIKYIECQFAEGMSWNTYGKYGWHIDHIKPCASFDLSKPEDQIKCFHYTNLQPLWAKDNLRKGFKCT